jgi:sulfur carrier protein ThiS adenylyltransferase
VKAPSSGVISMDRPEVTSRLRGSRVGIAGAGGLGSNVAMALARAGVGHLLLVDFDRVEESNLNRQYYFLDQVGEVKVEALKENINRAVKGCTVEVLNRKLESGSMAGPFSEADVVVEALDEAETKVRFIEEVMKAFPDKPVVAASGVAGYGNSDRIRLVRCGNLYLVQDPAAESSHDDILLSPKVGHFANYQANIVLEVIMGGSGSP